MTQSAHHSASSGGSGSHSSVKTPGQVLKRARLDQGLKLPQVVEVLCISHRYLKAVERCDFSQLPSQETYVLGFVRAYANYLRLDAQKLVREYKAMMRQGSEMDISAHQSASSRDVPVEEEMEQMVRPDRRVMIASILAAVGLVGVAFWLSPKMPQNPQHTAIEDTFEARRTQDDGEMPTPRTAQGETAHHAQEPVSAGAPSSTSTSSKEATTSRATRPEPAGDASRTSQAVAAQPSNAPAAPASAAKPSSTVVQGQSVASHRANQDSVAALDKAPAATHSSTVLSAREGAPSRAAANT